MTAVRLLFVGANESAPWGASETTWTALAIRLATTRAAEVWASVKWWPRESPNVSALEEAGCRVVRRAPDPIPRRAHQLPYGERHSGVLDVVRPAMVVISQGDNWEGLGWMTECGRRSIPYVVISNSASDIEWLDDEISSELADGYVGACRAYFVSQANLRLTELQVGRALPNARTTWFPYKVPFDVRIPWPDATDKLRLACVARLYPPTKGQDVLFQVLSLDKWRSRPVTVALFGDGPHEQVLRRLAGMLKLESVQFKGHVDNIVDIWRSYHALVLPSREEGFPAVIVEAALCGRPSLVTDVAGNTVLVRDGVTGYVAESPTIPAVDRALERLWAERANLAVAGERARELARNRVAADPTGDLLDDLGDLLEEVRLREARLAVLE